MREASYEGSSGIEHRTLEWYSDQNMKLTQFQPVRSSVVTELLILLNLESDFSNLFKSSAVNRASQDQG